jgi:hypothetical protein
LIVMPRSRSSAIESSTCACISRACRPAADLDEAVGQRRLAVVDVRDDGEIADQLHRDFGWCAGPVAARQKSRL